MISSPPASVDFSLSLQVGLRHPRGRNEHDLVHIQGDDDKIMSMRITNEQILQAYNETGSVWAAGKRLGCAGQTVHKRLKNLGVETTGSGREWTDEEAQELRRLVEECELPFLEVGARLDRSYASVALRASRLGIKAVKKARVKRERGYDKTSTAKHIKALKASNLSLTKYIREHNLKIGPFVGSWQRNFPEDWQDFCQTEYANIAPKRCVYCEVEFYPSNGKQIYCTQRCAGRKASDESYFGGKRRETIGMDQGQCQLCGVKPEKGLSSHHVYGKQNDPENDHLVALCVGCHDVVTRVSSRKWATDTDKLESLIHLVFARAKGAEYMQLDEPRMLHVLVEVEEFEDERFA